MVDGTPGRVGVRLPLGLIGMLGLVLAIEREVASRPLEFVGSSALLDWRTTGEAASSDEVRRAQILCFGDSLVKLGIYPSVLEAELGRPAYNLAVVAAQAPASYFLLRRSLLAGAKPEALIVDFHSVPLLFPPRQSAEYWPELLTTRELIDLAWVTRDLPLFARSTLAHALPSARDRHAIRARASAWVRGEEPPEAALYSALLRNGRIHRGAWILSTDGTNSVESPIVGAASPARGAGRWAAHRANAEYVRRFLDLAHGRAIPVFWLLPPTHPAWRAEAERSGNDAGHAGFVRGLQEDYPGLVVLDARRAGYGGGSFSDMTHLNRRGASTFSKAVARLTRAHLDLAGDPAPSRWVELLPTEGRPVDLPLEDLEQSIAAVRAPTEAARR